jgi:cysteine desulfurase/selenocysteine lyase
MNAAASELEAGAGTFDVEAARRDFPILGERVHGKPLVFLDSAASAQKPRAVIDTVSGVYEREYANIHRGVYYLSQRATDLYEGARETVRVFLNAAEAREIIFLRGTTEAINLVAQTWGWENMEPGDEVVVSTMEHHSNIVPWQILRERKGIVIRVIPIDEAGELVMEEYEKLLGPRTKLVAVTHCSNAIGTITPLKEIVRLAHDHGAKVMVDGAQAAPHLGIDVQDLDCDFYAFSGHKLYGPTATGVLYAKAEHLEAMPPYQGGGEMILSVSFEHTEYAAIPHKFEAGTPNIAGVVGLGAAIDYLQGFDRAAVRAHEQALLEYAAARLSEINSVRIYGTAKHKSGLISFTVDDVHPHDVGTILDNEGISVRTGHHCAQPTMDRFGVPAMVRASFGLYNTRDDVDALAAGIRRVLEVFA